MGYCKQEVKKSKKMNKGVHDFMKKLSKRGLAAVLAAVVAISALIVGLGLTYASSPVQERFKQENTYVTADVGRDSNEIFLGVSGIKDAESSDDAYLLVDKTKMTGVKAGVAAAVLTTSRFGLSFPIQVTDSSKISGYDLKDNGEINKKTGDAQFDIKANLTTYTSSWNATVDGTVGHAGYVRADAARSQVTWKSRNTDVAECTPAGLVTPKAKGTAVILGTFEDRWGAERTITFLVGVDTVVGKSKLSDLADAIKKAETIIGLNPNPYKAAGLGNLQNALTLANSLMNSVDPSDGDIDNRIAAINSAVSGLEAEGGTGGAVVDIPGGQTGQKKFKPIPGPDNVYEVLTDAGNSKNPQEFIYDPNGSMAGSPPSMNGDEVPAYKDGYVYYAEEGGEGSNIFVPIAENGTKDYNNAIFGGVPDKAPGNGNDRNVVKSGSTWYAEDPAGSNIWKGVDADYGILRTSGWLGGGADGKPTGTDNIYPILTKDGRIVAGPYNDGEEYYLSAGPNGRFDTTGMGGSPVSNAVSGDDQKLYDQGNGTLGTGKPGTVNPPGTVTVTSMTITGTPTKKTYKPGESFNAAGLTITLNKSDSSTEVITTGYTVSPNPLTAGVTSVTITHTASGKSANVSGLTVSNEGGNLGDDDDIEFEYEMVDTNVGKVFNADGYEWVVIGADTTNGSRELLITTTNIVNKTDFGNNNTYASSWLDGEMVDFYSGLTQLKNYIQPIKEAPVSGNLTVVDNDAKNGDMIKNSMKKVFALSEGEVTKYFGDPRVSGYKTATGAGTNWFWLRSAGTTGMAIRIDQNGIVAGTDVTNTNGGVRPAMWINLGMDILIKDNSDRAAFRRNQNKIFKADGIYWRVINADADTGHMLIVSRDNLGTCKVVSDINNPTTHPGYLTSNLNAQIINYNNATKLPRLFGYMQRATVNTEPSYDAAATTYHSYPDPLGNKTAFALSISDINKYFIAGIDGKATGGEYWLRSPGPATNVGEVTYGAQYASSAYYVCNDVAPTTRVQAMVDTGGSIASNAWGTYSIRGTQYSSYYMKASKTLDPVLGIRPAMFINISG